MFLLCFVLLYPIISTVHLFTLQKLNTMSPKCEVVQDLKANVLLQFAKRFREVDNIDTLAVATLLDPRFKTMYLDPSVKDKTLKKVSEWALGTERRLVDSKTNSLPPAPMPTGSLWDLHDQLVRT